MHEVIHRAPHLPQHRPNSSPIASSSAFSLILVSFPLGPAWCRLFDVSIHWLQVFVSPYGQGEWTDLDFQAIMCGCFVIKAGAESFKAYPNVFEAGNMALSVKADWSDLKEAVQQVMQVRGVLQPNVVSASVD